MHPDEYAISQKTYDYQITYNIGSYDKWAKMIINVTIQPFCMPDNVCGNEMEDFWNKITFIGLMEMVVTKN